jgi:hypothetical protein
MSVLGLLRPIDQSDRMGSIPEAPRGWQLSPAQVGFPINNRSHKGQANPASVRPNQEQASEAVQAAIRAGQQNISCAP